MAFTLSFLLNLSYVGHCEKDHCACAAAEVTIFIFPVDNVSGKVKQQGHQKCHLDCQVTLLVNATCHSAFNLVIIHLLRVLTFSSYTFYVNKLVKIHFCL